MLDAAFSASSGGSGGNKGKIMEGTKVDTAPVNSDTAGDAWVLFTTGIFSP